jgi:diguanylate cyclase (GGDEF)-like protein
LHFGIRARTAIFVTLTMLVMMVLMIFAARIVIKGAFDKLENQDSTKSVHLASNWVSGQSSAMGAIATSYGAWTPSYNFVVDRNRRFIRKFMKDSDIASLDIDFMVFLDTDGHVVWGKMIDPETRKQTTMPKGLKAYLAAPHDYLGFSDNFASIHGIVGLPEGAVVLGAAPIVTSQSKGSIRGTLVVGRVLTESDRKELARATNLDAEWFSTASPQIPADAKAALVKTRKSDDPLVEPVDDGTVVGYGLLRGFENKPAVVMKVTQSRTIVAEGRTVLKYTTVGLLVFIGVTILALVIVLNISVLSPLSQLSRRVREIGASDDPRARLPVKGHDEITHLATSINAMLGALEESREELVHLAAHDPLTKVYNRRRFEEDLARELAEHRRLGRGGALLWFDLDGFKQINDQFGHSAGDEVLVHFADALREQTREYSSLARFGGDEFVMLVPGADQAEALRAAQRLLDLFGAQPVTVAGTEIVISTSIGVALYPSDGTTVDELLAHADAAMYDAKKSGNGLVRSFRPAIA